VAWDNLPGAGAMLRVRDRVVERLALHRITTLGARGPLGNPAATADATTLDTPAGADDADDGFGGGRLFGVDARTPWAAFSVTSQPSRRGAFSWHYDAESGDEYRALFVARGGDDCGAPSVHYRAADGAVRHLAVKTGHGYLIRGSQVSKLERSLVFFVCVAACGPLFVPLIVVRFDSILKYLLCLFDLSNVCLRLRPFTRSTAEAAPTDRGATKRTYGTWWGFSSAAGQAARLSPCVRCCSLGAPAQTAPRPPSAACASRRSRRPASPWPQLGFPR
jgi:hypothetical protein